MSTESPRLPGIFVVGTDTGVGKTRVAAALARTWMLEGHRVGVLKPVSTGAARGATGLLVSDDGLRLAESIATEGSPFPPPPPERVGPLVFEAPLAPPVAARRAGTPLEPAALVRATDDALAWWAEVAGVSLMVVEGVGGLLCPVAEGGSTVADLAVHLDFPLLIVAQRGLGTLNHTLLTVEAARSRGLRVAGIVLNAARTPDAPDGADPAEASNAEELARLLPDLAILADYPHGPSQPPVPIAPEAGHWLDLALPPRPLASGGAIPDPTSIAPPGPVPSGPPLAGSVLDDPAPSDDELSPAAPDLLGSSSGSAEPMVSIAPAVEPPANSPTSAVFPALNLTPPPPTSAAPVDTAVPIGPSAAAPEPSDAEGEFDHAPPASWRSVLLTSYASAITLALIWTLIQHRNNRDVAPPEAAAPDPAHGAGRLGDRSRTIAPLEPIPSDRFVPLGQTLAIGSLLVEPIEVNRQDVMLDRVDLTGKAERKSGGRRAITLRVQLQNTSRDAVFAPVDPAFVRPDAQEQSETLLELADGRKIYTYPLPVEGEWSIAGQSFGDLRPGESREVLFATTPDAPSGAESKPGTWRIKLRVSGTETSVVGVRLNPPASPDAK